VGRKKIAHYRGTLRDSPMYDASAHRSATMHQFSTVKKACDYLTRATSKHWETRYEMLHGQRFYFVWHSVELPFNQRQLSLFCRGDKQTVLRKLENLANGPQLPRFF
jgi:hypothetical protein